MTMKTNNSPNVSHQAQHNYELVAAYSVQVSSLSEEDGGGFEALFPVLARSVVGYGETQQDALLDLHQALPVFLEAVNKTGQALPAAPAVKEWEDFSGKFNVRVPKILHSQLVELAEEQGVSLNSLVQTVLTSGATALTAGMTFGAVERVKAKPKLIYSWEDTDTSVSQVYDTALSFTTKERNSDEWQITQEG